MRVTPVLILSLVAGASSCIWSADDGSPVQRQDIASESPGTGGSPPTSGTGGTNGGSAGTGTGGGSGGTSGRGAPDAGTNRDGAGSGGSAGTTTDSGLDGRPALQFDSSTPLGYAHDIAPILAIKCATCHTIDKKGNYNWTYDNLVTNSAVINTATVNCTYLDTSKRRVVPGKPDVSLLWIKISHIKTDLNAAHCDDPMPEGTMFLTDLEKAMIQAWIQQGAKP
jgi:hypothetical protein